MATRAVAERLDLAALPKAELHIHFEASLRPGTAREWSKRYKRPMPGEGPFSGLGDFVVAYEGARDLIGSLGDLRRCAAELVLDASAQGVVWSEVHLIPPTYAGRLGREEGIIEAVLDGFAQGSDQAVAAARPSAAGLIIGVNRGLGSDPAERSLDLALRYSGHGVVGLGLAGDEANHPPSRFANLFRRAREGGLLSLPHGGEGARPENVRACVEELGANRICHGVRAVEDPEVVKLLVDHNVCLDVCPSSNVSLQVSPSLEQHQLMTLLDAGVRVSLGSDGSLFSGASANDEYVTAHTLMGLPPTTLAEIARTSIEASSCPSRCVHAPWRGSATGPRRQIASMARPPEVGVGRAREPPSAK